MKKALIITYYWPPSGGTGTQRCLKFARHLPSFGWQPVIFTTSSRGQQQNDVSLIDELPEGIEVLSVAAWEPYSLYRFFTGRSKTQATTPHLNFDKKPGLRDRIARYVRDNYFIPDARKFWIKPSKRFLFQYLSDNKIDVILTSGPPHSVHLIGLGIKKRFPELKWVADFRDPWMHIHSYHNAALSSSANKKHFALETEVLRNADAVITVSNPIRKQLEVKTNVDKQKFHTITNSFDSIFHSKLTKNTEKFVITHAGTLYPNRSPIAFWKSLSSLVNENKNFRNRLEINLVGKVDAVVLNQIHQVGLGNYLRHTDFVSHKEAQLEMAQSDILLVLVNNVPESGGILTGKFFEYLGAGKPIIAIGTTTGDLADIIKETRCGFMIDYHDELKMKESILEVFSGRYKYHTENTNNYSAKTITGKLAQIFENL